MTSSLESKGVPFIETSGEGDSQVLKMLRELYLDFTDEEIALAKEKLDRYIVLAWDIFSVTKPLLFDSPLETSYDENIKVEPS
ncbi:MAG: hypothetical protein DMG65_12175 [Candidatus Angelobacter sp. Gp1-AA117]|nr:MAG: hypothetical protein DMG65_12175 [Candidatus Angelobacter sp. Gp1-AA117]